MLPGLRGEPIRDADLPLRGILTPFSRVGDGTIPLVDPRGSQGIGGEKTFTSTTSPIFTSSSPEPKRQVPACPKRVILVGRKDKL